MFCCVQRESFLGTKRILQNVGYRKNPFWVQKELYLHFILLPSISALLSSFSIGSMASSFSVPELWLSSSLGLPWFGFGFGFLSLPAVPHSIRPIFHANSKMTIIGTNLWNI